MDPITVNSKDARVASETLAGRLLAHFDATRRDMPWRRTTDPYEIWVSEVMLQQTRVDTVIPYYARWLQRFPTLRDLADAHEPDVLRAWEGLGYYSRARNLQKAARVVCETHNGRVPDTAETLRTLPGVGAYTAGAISSIAFGRAEPAIDGNARRVFSRLLDLQNPTIPAIQGIVRDMVPADRPGDFNQAVMELGATICTPRPRCAVCPVSDLCLALQRGTIPLRPGTPPQRTVPAFNLAVAVLIDPHGSVLLTQRPPTGLLAGFWEFPSRIATVSAVARTARSLAAQLTGTTPPRARRITPVVHAFSHRIETYHPFVYTVAPVPTHAVCDVTSTSADRDRLQSLPLSVAQRHIARLAGL